jgi:hypothetical protein
MLESRLAGVEKGVVEASDAGVWSPSQLRQTVCENSWLVAENTSIIAALREREILPFEPIYRNAATRASKTASLARKRKASVKFLEAHATSFHPVTPGARAAVERGRKIVATGGKDEDDGKLPQASAISFVSAPGASNFRRSPKSFPRDDESPDGSPGANEIQTRTTSTSSSKSVLEASEREALLRGLEKRLSPDKSGFHSSKPMTLDEREKRVARMEAALATRIETTTK